MQVANALNNNIRILFNPRVEAFKLFDFLMVKSDQDRYLAQIIEIYDDKFDASQNVAKLKLFYKITQNNEVMPYDNFTPNKECEIVKIKQDEIENFVNQDKETFIFATNVKNSSALNVQYDFFNNAVVLADKIENVNSISLNLAKNLSNKRNVVLIDSTGIVEFEGAKKIKASKNFKMPLSYSTIDFVFDECLKDASLEFQAIGGEIINEIKKFARSQQGNFIPFNAFTRVLLEQYKATPYTELKLLLVRLKKLQMDEIFARTKKDKETLFKTIEKNPITILDLSSIDIYWQKAYLEYLVSEIEQDIYLFVRVNDENFDVDLINKIYCEKKNIKFIPNVSYNYKKLPSIMQYCKNYILMPSLYQRSDFLDANFALGNLIMEGCILFGQNTDNFLYLAKDYELEMQEKRKNYRKIALSLLKQDENSEVEQTVQKEENKQQDKQKQITTPDSQRLLEELGNFEEQQKIRQQANENFENIIEEDVDYFDNNQEKEVFEEIENPALPEKSSDDFTTFEDTKVDEDKNAQQEDVEVKKDSNDDFQELNDSDKEPKAETQEEKEFDELLKQDLEDDETIEEESLQNKTVDLKADDELLLDEETSEPDDKDDKPSNTEERQEDSLKIDVLNADLIDLSDQNDASDTVVESNDNNDTFKFIEDDKKESETENKGEINDETNLSQDESVGFSDDELDFFQIAEESSANYESEKSREENPPVDDSDLDLNEIANNSIDTSFEQIIETSKQPKKETFNIDSENKIDADILKTKEQKESLPVFKEEVSQKENPNYQIGSVIYHKKYGRGTITKTIKYEQRQLLQIEFEESGKKLLDPTVADIRPEQ